MNVKNEIKSIIVRSGMTMQQVVDLLSQMGTPKSRRLFGERRSNEMSEPCCLRSGARDMKFVTTNGWSDSISNFSNKLARASLRYREAVQLADVMGYDLVWQKRRER